MTAQWVAVACLLSAAVVLAVRPSGSVLRRLPDRTALSSVRLRLDRRRSIVMGVAGAAGVGWLLGGPVAAVVVMVYAALVVRALARRASRRRTADVRTRTLDALCALAADLRAGLPPAAVATGVPASTAADSRVAELTAAVWRLAESTGAPAADLVERIEVDARAADRATTSAAAQAAGAQATAMLLAALPLGGIGLGYTIGVDALEVLLHTTLGAACAIGAVLLQCAGLAWSDRLIGGPRPMAGLGPVGEPRPMAGLGPVGGPRAVAVLGPVGGPSLVGGPGPTAQSGLEGGPGLVSGPSR